MFPDLPERDVSCAGQEQAMSRASTASHLERERVSGSVQVVLRDVRTSALPL
jgi:hypothetical protein